MTHGVLKRVRRVAVDPKVLVGLLTEGAAWRVVEGLPCDAHILAVFVDESHYSGRLILHVWSATFDPVPDGGLIPFHPDLHVAKA